jgi:hypothetical protein
MVSPRGAAGCFRGRARPLLMEEKTMNHHFVRSVSTLSLALTLGLGLAVAPTTVHANPAAPAAASKASAQETRMAMRKLWEDHIAYTRNYIISAVGGLGDADAVAARLMKNQEDIGNAVKPYYGAAAGDKLTALLKEHIKQAAVVVNAAKAGDKAKLDAEQAKWSANGKEIAAFLAGANPNWKQAEMESMLQKHLDLTTGEVVGRLHKDWAADLRAYDAGHTHMLMFADMLTDGIAKQFPAKFKP